MTPADYAIIAASLGVLGIYLLLAILRGTLKFILITASTAAGGFSAYATLHYLPVHVGRPLREAPDWVLPALTLVAGIAAFVAIKALLFIIFKPITFGGDDKEKRGGFSIGRSVFALACGLTLAWGAGILLRYGGTLASMRLADAKARGDSVHSLLWKADHWYHRFEESELGAWHRGTDPLARPGQLHAAELALRMRELESLPAEWQAGAESAAWQHFLAQIHSPRIQSLIESGDYSSLLEEIPAAPPEEHGPPPTDPSP